MKFATFFEFTVGFGFGSFACLYFVILRRGIPDMLRMLKRLRLPEDWR